MRNSWSGVSADGLHPRPLYPMRAIRGGDDEALPPNEYFRVLLKPISGEHV
jgi:hypothetical protein